MPLCRNKEEALAFLEKIGQEHLLSDWQGWPEFLRCRFLQQISKIPQDFYRQQLQELQEPAGGLADLVSPELVPQTDEGRVLAESLLDQGKVGVLILAGGQGTRLGFPGPKGCFPLPSLKHTLFEILLEKCRHTSQKAGEPLPVAIMTSPLNHKQTRQYLEKHHFFGLDENQLDVFVQSMRPFLDEKRNWFLESPGRLAEGPCGNGEAIAAGQKVWEKWQQRNVQFVQIIPVDNLLAEPFDPDLIGTQARQNTELAVLSTGKKYEGENVGVLGQREGKLYVHEYTKDPLPNLSLAFLGIFSCSLSFLLKHPAAKLPWHTAKKKEKKLIKKGFGWQQQEVKAWKFEKFLFDLFPYASNFCVIQKPRGTCFAPIKTLEGEYGIEQAEKAFFQKELYHPVDRKNF
ncbi:MAG: UTP--glucose-1-phosphate uridylyltransferase [Simkaniaceae bacterium]